MKKVYILAYQTNIKGNQIVYFEKEENRQIAIDILREFNKSYATTEAYIDE